MEKLTKLHATHFVEQAISISKQACSSSGFQLLTSKRLVCILYLVEDSARLVDMMTKYHGRFQSEAPPLN